jgi:hypothetical protein
MLVDTPASGTLVVTVDPANKIVDRMAALLAEECTIDEIAAAVRSY